MQIAQGVGGKGVPEVGHQFGVEIADLVGGEVGLKDEVRPAAEVQRRRAKRLFHRQREVPVAADARLVAHGLAERLAETDAHVLDRVVLVDVQVAGGGDAQIERRMLGQQGQHVVEKADAGGDPRLADAVEQQVPVRCRFPPSCGGCGQCGT